MQRIPGNRNFDAQPRYEFATTVKHYYGKSAYVVFQIFYNISLQALNIVAMIVSAQVSRMINIRNNLGQIFDFCCRLLTCSSIRCQVMDSPLITKA